MQWGSNLEMLRSMEEETGITPLALKDKPVLDDRLFFFYDIFVDLSRDRNYDAAGGPMAIGRKSFVTYCQMEEWSVEEARWAWPVIAMIDDVWLDCAAKKAEKK